MKRHVRWLRACSLLVVAFVVLATTLLHYPAIGRASNARSREAGQTEASTAVTAAPRVSGELPTDDVMAAAERRQRQARRRRHLVSACRRLGQPTLADTTIIPANFRSVFVDDVRQTLYCAVPKVATTNWKRVLLMLTGRTNASSLPELASADVHGALERRYLVRLSRFDPDDIRHRIDNYFKFLFVRHPFERIVSAYENKFARPYTTFFQRREGRQIIRRYRKRPTQESLERGHDVTFPEFVRYLTDPLSATDRPLNEHWQPYTQICSPCQVGYDVIGKYETLGEDAADVLSAIASRSPTTDHNTLNIQFPTFRRTNHTANMLSHFAEISSDDMQHLYNLFAADFELFGYNLTYSALPMSRA